MAVVAGNLDPRHATQNLFGWFGYHFTVYLSITAVTTVLFLAGAAAYSYLLPADVISIETQSPRPAAKAP